MAAIFAGAQSASLYGSYWTLTDLGTLGGSETFADSINDLGQVVGISRLPDDIGSHAFFYANGVMQDISPVNSGDIRAGRLGLNNLGVIASGVVSGGAYYPVIYEPAIARTTTLGSLGANSGFTGVATGINDSGVAIGYSYLDSSTRHAFIYRNGSMSDLGSLGGYSAALAINNFGMAAGFSSETLNGFARAVVWQNNSMLDISNGLESEARAVNDFGQVVGETSTPAGGMEAFLWSAGSSQTLGTLPTGRTSQAYSINNIGEIVGTADIVSSITYETNPITGHVNITTNYHDHAFLYTHGSMIDLNTLISTNSAWELNYAYGINNSDQIVGWGSLDGGQHFRSFILQVPEPAMPSLFVAALSARLFYQRWIGRSKRRRLNLRGSSIDKSGWM